MGRKGDEVESGGRSEDEPERETWNNAFDFLLACIGFSVGLGNIWRFPFLCYKNGGGAFLIPYFVCVIAGGIPLFFLEVAIGQFMSEGGVTAWRLCPVFEGIGWATAAIVFYLNCYYNVILAWAFYYVFASFQKTLPWTTCNNTWNTDVCEDNYTKFIQHAVNGVTPIPWNENGRNLIDPVTEFWERKVLDISDAVDEPGEIKWDLTLCLLLAWIVVCACIIKGIKSSGRVMYVTATSPYIFMLVLLIRSAFLEGAGEGLKFYLDPQVDKLNDMTVWVDAGTQIFFSYSISLCALTSLGSYNKFHHNCYRDSILFALTNSGTSIFGGFVIFMTLGHMSEISGVPIDQVAESGPGLAFIAYPKAVAQMPVAPLWSILFFIMVILLGLDSQFVGVEGLITTLVDLYPKWRKSPSREIFTVVVCIVHFFIGLSMTTNGGMYVFQLLDYYSGSKIILLVAFFMCIAIAYCYGVNRFYDNIEMMIGSRINPYMKICWVVVSPIFTLVVFILGIIDYSELSYNRPGITYDYPQWAVGVGWAMAVSTSIWIPIVAVYKIVTYACAGRPLSDVLKPEGLRAYQLRPQDMEEYYERQGRMNPAYKFDSN